MRSKKVIDREEYVQKIRAAVEARATATSSSSPGPTPWLPLNLDEAIRRVEAAREAGADASFVEAPTSLARTRGHRPTLPGAERGQYDRRRQDACPAEAATRRSRISS